METDKELLNSMLALKDEFEKTRCLSDEDIKKIMPVGSVWKIFYSEGNLSNLKLTVIAIIENQVVYKYWAKHKKRWFYNVESFYRFVLSCKTGHLFRVKGKNRVVKL